MQFIKKAKTYHNSERMEYLLSTAYSLMYHPNCSTPAKFMLAGYLFTYQNSTPSLHVFNKI